MQGQTEAQTLNLQLFLVLNIFLSLEFIGISHSRDFVKQRDRGPKIKVGVYIVEKSMYKDGTSLTSFGPSILEFVNRCQCADNAILELNYPWMQNSNDHGT